MHTRINYRAALIALYIVLRPCLLSAQDEGPILTIKDAVDQAMKLNPEINKMQARLESKNVEWKTAIGIYSPEMGFAREGISAIEPLPFQEQRFFIQQEFDFPLVSVYRLRRIGFEREAMLSDLEALKKEVTTNVKSFYADVIYANSIRKLRADAYLLSKEIHNAAISRADSSAELRIDRLAAELRLVSAENDQYEAEKMLHEARYSLFNYMGINPEQQRYDIRFSDTLLTHKELIEQEVALYALENQPLYIAAQNLVTAARFGVKEAKSGFLPSMRINYLIQDFGTGYHFRGFETGLSIPVWGMFEQSGRVRMAESGLTETLWDKKAVELEIKQKIELAWHSYDKSQVTIELYKKQLKEKSELLLAMANQAYRLGEVDLLKLMDSQEIFLSSQEKYLDALRDYYLRLIELEQYVGIELVY